MPKLIAQCSIVGFARTQKGNLLYADDSVDIVQPRQARAANCLVDAQAVQIERSEQDQLGAGLLAGHVNG